MIAQQLNHLARAAFRLSGILVALAVHAAWLAQPLGWQLRLFHLVLLGLSVARPRHGLLVFASLAPLTTTLSEALQSPRAGWCLLEAMMWAVVTGLLVRNPSAGEPLRLRVPAGALSIVALASAVVVIAGDPHFIVGYAGIGSAAADLMAGQLFEWIPPWIPLHLALILSLALIVAVGTEHEVRLDRQMGVRLILMLLVGHAVAVAAGLSRLAAAALREEEFISAWIRIMSDVRYYSQYDVNAAGSTLVIVACAGLGLIATTHRLVASVALPFALVGIWMTGSRAALTALIGVLLLRALSVAVAGAGRRSWLTSIVTITVLAATAGALYTFYPGARNVAAGDAYESRVILARMAWRAGLSDPGFGVGIGRLPERAEEFGSSEAVRLMGARGLRENAHNQFLQLFAELGLVGVAAVALLIGSAGWPAGLGRQVDPLLSWTSCGLVASLLTWLLGHPLLVPEAAVIFWLFVGIAAGLSPAPAVRARAWRVATAGAVSLAALVVILLPVRTARAARMAYLDHQGIGVSALWHHEDGVSYRWAGAEFTLFLRSSSAVTVPLRGVGPPSDPLVIEVFLRGRLIDRVDVPHETWRRLRILLPESDREFERVEFILVGAAADRTGHELVQVGKATNIRLVSSGTR